MAKREDTTPENFLHALIPPEEIRSEAHRLGVVVRRRRLDPVVLLTVVVLMLAGRERQSIAAMRRNLALRSGVLLARSAFWARLSPSFALLTRWMLDRLAAQAASHPPTHRGLLRGFKDVVAVDSTVVKVNDLLAKGWRGTRKSSAKAAIKVHTRIRVVTGELLRWIITPETRADCKKFGISWADAGTLFLLDRGFSSPSLWFRVQRVGAFFVTRLPASHHALIVGSNRTHRGRSRKLVGQLLRDTIRGLTRQILDVDCEFRVHVRAYGTPHGRNERRRFRVVGVYNRESRRHHLYVTNLPVDRARAEDIEHLYRLRWEAETFYKVAKSGLGLDDVRLIKQRHRVETFVHAALIRASVAMQAKCRAEPNVPRHRWINPVTWVRVWSAAMPELAHRLLNRATRTIKWSWKALAVLAMDPERKRPPTRRWIEDPEICCLAVMSNT